MKLKSFTYSEFVGEPREWLLKDLRLNSTNLIVGKNSTGKSRSLNVINALSMYLMGERVQAPTKIEAIFDFNGSIYSYNIESAYEKILLETLTIDGRKVLNRRSAGTSTIFAEKIAGGTDMEFVGIDTVLSAFSRRDSSQHSYLEPLYNWADTLRHYQFGGTLGKDVLTVFIPGNPEPSEKDGRAVTGLFRNGIRDFGEPFKASILRDMSELGYEIEDIDIGQSIIMNAPGSVLLVKERDLAGQTDAWSMSQGMFRVLSLLIHTNFAQFKASASTILIDDIGEGLDFDRSFRLINLLRNKADKNNFQLVMTTNDRFVMNEVPLDDWIVLLRQSNIVHTKDSQNSKDIFENFKYTGLNNFSFVEMDFINDNEFVDYISDEEKIDE